MTSDPQCPGCVSGPDDEFILSAHDINYGLGTIISLKESVNYMIQTELLERTARGLGFSLNTVEDMSRWDRSGRPAVVLRACRRTKSGEPIPVCLFATFNGESDRARLSLVLQHFCAPIFPHANIREEPGGIHFHTHPQWFPERCGKPDTWIILFQFESRAQIEGKWHNLASKITDRTKSSSFTMESDGCTLVREKSQEKWREWLEMCEGNEAHFLACLREYKVCGRLSNASQASGDGRVYACSGVERIYRSSPPTQ